MSFPHGSAPSLCWSSPKSDVGGALVCVGKVKEGGREEPSEEARALSMAQLAVAAAPLGLEGP